MKRWPKMGGMITFIVDGRLVLGTVVRKNKTARQPMFYVADDYYAEPYGLCLSDEGTTWVRGRPEKNNSAFVAAALLVRSAR